MTQVCRILGALIISVVAGLTTGCGSSTVPPSGAAAKATAYCAPLERMLKTAEKGQPSGATRDEYRKSLIKLTDPVVAAATAAGKTDVADAFQLFVESADPAHTRQEFLAAAKKAQPSILKDCGFNLDNKL